MADEKISAMPVASSVADADIAPIVQSGANKSATMLVIHDYVLTSPVLIGTKARLVAIAGPPGGVKLQVKNNSGTWEDAGEWLAST
jgi:hypothetical protein